MMIPHRQSRERLIDVIRYVLKYIVSVSTRCALRTYILITHYDSLLSIIL